MKHRVSPAVSAISSLLAGGAAAMGWFDIASARLDRRALVHRARDRAHGHASERDRAEHGGGHDRRDHGHRHNHNNHHNHRDHNNNRDHHNHRDHDDHRGGNTNLDFAS